MNRVVSRSSVVRRIWGTTDIVLFIFAGASAEFALNRQVDWLFYTGKLPADPIGRLFSTVEFAQRIIFAEAVQARHSITSINAIHKGVEASRGRSIPATAYKDVLFMLIYYSISAFELLERKLSEEEKEEILNVFKQVGEAMGLTGIPDTLGHWQPAHRSLLTEDLEYSHHTRDLFVQYRKHLGLARYRLLLLVQSLLVPKEVNALLHLGQPWAGKLLLLLYRPARRFALSGYLVLLLMPRPFRNRIRLMNALQKLL